MRRLIAYLRPYRAQVARRVRGDHAGGRHGAGAALSDEARHRSTHRDAPARGAAGIGGHVRCGARAGLRRRIHADVDDAADGAADHVRHADGDLPASAAPRCPLLRSQPGRAPDDACHLRRGRAERSVHVRRRHDLRRRVHAGRHHGRDALDELAAGARGVCRPAADCVSSRSGSGEMFASRTASCAAGSRGSMRFFRKTSPGCRRCSCFAAKR